MAGEEREREREEGERERMRENCERGQGVGEKTKTTEREREKYFFQPLVLEEFGGEFEFTGNWHETFAIHKQQRQQQQQHVSPRHKPLRITNFYSDRLFQPWYCASSPFLSSWLKHDNIPREQQQQLTLDQFIEKYESRNQPVILSGVVSEWNAYRKWTREWLLENYGDKKFAVGPVQMTLRCVFLGLGGVAKEGERGEDREKQAKLTPVHSLYLSLSN